MTKRKDDLIPVIPARGASPTFPARQPERTVTEDAVLQHENINHKMIHGSMVDTLRRLVNVFRSSTNEPVANLFKRGVDTIDDVQQGTSRRWVSTGVADVNGNVNLTGAGISGFDMDNVSQGTSFRKPKAGALDSTGNIDLAGSAWINKVLDNVGDGVTYGKTILSYLSSGKVFRVLRGGVDEIPDNLFKKSVDTLDSVADSSSFKRTTPNEKTGAGYGFLGLNSLGRLTTGVEKTGDIGGLSAHLVSRSQPGSVFRETFEELPSTWPSRGGGGTIALVTGQGAAGGNVVQATGTVLREGPVNIAYDPSKLHRIRFRVKQVSTSATPGADQCYLGITAYAADGVTKVDSSNTTGTNGHYVAASAVHLGSSAPLGTWQEFTGYFKGVTGGASVGAPSSDASTPAQLSANVRYIRPYWVVNYTGVSDGVAYVDEVVIDVLEESGTAAVWKTLDRTTIGQFLSGAKDSRGSVINNMFRYAIDTLDGVGDSGTYGKTLLSYLTSSKPFKFFRPVGGHDVDADLLSAGLAFSPENMLPNPGGQEGALGANSAGWSLAAGANMVTANDAAKIGDRSHKIVNSTAQDTQWQPSSNYNVSDGDCYEISGWVKTSALSGTGDGAVIKVAIASGVTGFTVLDKVGSDDSVAGFNYPSAIVLKTAGGGTQDWTFLKVVFKVIGSGSLIFRVQLGGNGTLTGTAWFDGLVFKRVNQQVLASGLSAGRTTYNGMDQRSQRADNDSWTGNTWVRVLAWAGGSARGAARIRLAADGGNITPGAMEFVVGHEWTTASQLRLVSSAGQLNVVSVRLIRDSTGGNGYFDVQFASTGGGTITITSQIEMMKGSGYTSFTHQWTKNPTVPGGAAVLNFDCSTAPSTGHSYTNGTNTYENIGVFDSTGRLKMNAQPVITQAGHVESRVQDSRAALLNGMLRANIDTLDSVVDGGTYKRPVGVNSSGKITDASVNPNVGLGWYDNGAKGANFTIDWNNGNIQEVQLTATGLTVTLANPAAGRVYTLVVLQDASGGRALPTFSPALHYGDAGVPVWNLGPNKINVISMLYTGTVYLAINTGTGF